MSCQQPRSFCEISHSLQHPQLAFQNGAHPGAQSHTFGRQLAQRQPLCHAGIVSRRRWPPCVPDGETEGRRGQAPLPGATASLMLGPRAGTWPQTGHPGGKFRPRPGSRWRGEGRSPVMPSLPAPAHRKDIRRAGTSDPPALAAPGTCRRDQRRPQPRRPPFRGCAA